MSRIGDTSGTEGLEEIGHENGEEKAEVSPYGFQQLFFGGGHILGL